MTSKILFVVCVVLVLALLAYALRRDRWYKARWAENADMNRTLIARSRDTAEQSLSLLRESLAVQQEILAELRHGRGG